jgi:hypothetical protein
MLTIIGPDDMWALEHVSDNVFRLILFDRDEDTGARSVKDIAELQRKDFRYAAKMLVDYEISPCRIGDDPVDLGRKKSHNTVLKFLFLEVMR